MVHLIPRKENDNINFQIPQKTISEQELGKIKDLLSKNFGTKPREQEHPMPIIPKGKRVVEAEFKEKKPGKKRDKKQVKKASESGINLDDIAKVLGAR